MSIVIVFVLVASLGVNLLAATLYWRVYSKLREIVLKAYAVRDADLGHVTLREHSFSFSGRNTLFVCLKLESVAVFVTKMLNTVSTDLADIEHVLQTTVQKPTLEAMVAAIRTLQGHPIFQMQQLGQRADGNAPASRNVEESQYISQLRKIGLERPALLNGSWHLRESRTAVRFLKGLAIALVLLFHFILFGFVLPELYSSRDDIEVLTAISIVFLVVVLWITYLITRFTEKKND